MAGKEQNVVSIPKHRKVREWFLEQVASEKFQPGEQIPGETEMMELHNVSRATIRRAMSDLEFEGIIRRYRGKGTFLLEPANRNMDTQEKRRWGYLCRHWVAGRVSVLSGLESLAQRTGTELVVEYVGDNPDSIKAAVKRMLGLDVTDMIVEPSPYLPADIYRPLVEAHVSLVLVGLPVSGLDAPVIVFDHHKAGREATRHLLDMNHRRIGYVGSPRYWVIDQQINGWSEMLTENGIEPRKEWLSFESSIADEHSFTERGYRPTLHLLSLPLPERPTAIIALNDETAANAYRAIKARGLRIPHDISVIAIAGSSAVLAASLDPPLTVWHNWPTRHTMGQVAAQTLARMSDGTLSPAEKIIFVDSSVMPRGSVTMAP